MLADGTAAATLTLASLATDARAAAALAYSSFAAMLADGLAAAALARVLDAVLLADGGAAAALAYAFMRLYSQMEEPPHSRQRSVSGRESFSCGPAAFFSPGGLWRLSLRCDEAGCKRPLQEVQQRRRVNVLQHFPLLQSRLRCCRSVLQLGGGQDELGATRREPRA